MLDWVNNVEINLKKRKLSIYWMIEKKEERKREAEKHPVSENCYDQTNMFG